MKIGIDPDAHLSGVAWYEDGVLQLNNLSFFDLFDHLQKAMGLSEVVIEAGWLNKSNWHAKKGQSISVVAEIGERTGANHETGRKIVEMCDYLGLYYKLVRPTRSKLNSVQFCALTGIKRSNQEQRDAAMLIFEPKNHKSK
jgi:hypothetical protein